MTRRRWESAGANHNCSIECCRQCYLKPVPSKAISIPVKLPVWLFHRIWPRGTERLAGPLMLLDRLAERLKQRTVDRIALRIVFRMPLHAEGEARRIRDPDRLDGAVLGDALYHDSFAGFENALAVQRIDANGLATQQRCKGAAGNEIDLMAIGENDRRIRMDFA